MQPTILFSVEFIVIFDVTSYFVEIIMTNLRKKIDNISCLFNLATYLLL